MDKEFEQFLIDVKTMRELQKEFFRTKNVLLIKECKAAEVAVDNSIRQLESEESQSDKQIDMFA